MTPGTMFQRLWHFNVAAVLVLIVAAWPSLWYLWLAPARVRPRPPAVPAPVIRIIPDAVAQTDGLWSPLVFSLPTRYGFSRTVQMEWLETRGVPVVAPVQPPLLAFERGGYPLPDTPAPVLAARARAAVTVYQAARTATPAAPVTRLADPLAIPSAHLAAAGFRLPEAWQTNLPEIPRPWSLTAVVELNQHGAVRHVFIVAPHENAELNAAANRVLRRGRVDGPVSDRQGTVTLALP